MVGGRWEPWPKYSGRGIGAGHWLAAVVGLGFHLNENLSAGPLDRDYADRWDSMSQVEQLVAAGSGDVGPAPTLAPGALAQIGGLLLLASIGHPALKRKEAPGEIDPVPVAGGA